MPPGIFDEVEERSPDAERGHCAELCRRTPHTSTGAAIGRAAVLFLRVRSPRPMALGAGLDLPLHLLSDPLGNPLLCNRNEWLATQPGRDEDGLRSPGSQRVTG